MKLGSVYSVHFFIIIFLLSGKNEPHEAENCSETEGSAKHLCDVDYV